MKNILGFALALALAPFAQAQTQTQTSGLDINDVAVLFPIDGGKQLFPKISLDNKAPLVSKSVLDDVIAAAAALGATAPIGTTSIDKLADYYVTGFRYDPCAPKDHMGPEVGDCLAELRLIVQPIDSFGPSDTALHLIYGLGDEAPVPGDEALADLFKVKAKGEELMKLSTSGLPLNVNPILAAAAKDGNQEVAALYENLVRKYARPEKLKKLTMMGLATGSQTHWIFFGGNIVDGKWIQDEIPNLSDNNKRSVELNLNSSEIFLPTPANIDVSTFGFFHRELLADGQIDLVRAEVHRIENPNFTNRNNSDCLSCHTATSLHTSSASLVPVYIEGLTANAPKGITAYPAQGILQRHRLHWNMRAFGYFSILPTISMHTVNEAGKSAAKVNEILSRVNPGRDCSAVQETVVSCYFKAVQGIGPQGPIDNSAKCQDSCQAAGPALLVQADSFGPNGEGSTPLAPTEAEVKPEPREPLYTDPAQGSLLLLKHRCTPRNGL